MYAVCLHNIVWLKKYLTRIFDDYAVSFKVIKCALFIIISYW